MYKKNKTIVSVDEAQLFIVWQFWIMDWNINCYVNSILDWLKIQVGKKKKEKS